MIKPPFTLGPVGHFGLHVKNPKTNADWYVANLGMTVDFEFDGGMAVSSPDVTIVLTAGRPSPTAIGHISFHLPDLDTLERAVAFLRERDVRLEDPGDEIGPEAPGSPNVGAWLHDPDGYRLELSVPNGAKRR